MIPFSEIQDKRIALLIWNLDKEKDAHVYCGKIIQKDGHMCFVNEERKWQLTLDEEQFSRLRIVTENVKSILCGADYGLTMSMGKLPNDDKEGFDETGMKWHSVSDS